MHDNPYSDGDSLHESFSKDSFEPPKRPRFSVMKGLLLFAIGAVVIALLFPVTRRAPNAARRTQCKNNLKQIGLALFNYECTYGAFPPAYTVDAYGKPLHSWRTLILPFLDQQPLYEKIDLSKAWNDPSNAQAYNARFHTYSCPSAKLPAGQTTYLAIVTPDSCLRPVEPRQLSEITDGTSITWMVVEAPPNQAVHWMAPLDADQQFLLDFGDKTKFAHTGGMNVLLADGSVHFVTAKMPIADRMALTSVSGHEKPPEF